MYQQGEGVRFLVRAWPCMLLAALCLWIWQLGEGEIGQWLSAGQNHHAPNQITGIGFARTLVITLFYTAFTSVYNYRDIINLIYIYMIAL